MAALDKISVPEVIRQFGENALNKSNPEHVRQNYIMMLDNVQRYCEKVLQNTAYATKVAVKVERERKK